MSSKKVKVDDFETKFSLNRIKRGTSSHYRELIKKYFLYENELCDWIINLWKYAKVWSMIKLLKFMLLLI